MTHPDYPHSHNPHRLMRIRGAGGVAGVCAGLADYFNVDVTWVRLGYLAFFVFAFPFAAFGYVAAVVLLPVRDVQHGPSRARTPEEDAFWRGVSRRPGATFSDLRYRFRDLDERLQDIERVVTSDEWRLRRQFKEIE